MPSAAMVAIDVKTGELISVGDTVTSFRGETAILSYISRAATPGKSGKVCVTWPGMETMNEYYDKVFGLRISTLRSCGCVIDATQDLCHHA